MSSDFVIVAFSHAQLTLNGAMELGQKGAGDPADAKAAKGRASVKKSVYSAGQGKTRKLFARETQPFGTDLQRKQNLADLAAIPGNETPSLPTSPQMKPFRCR